MSAAATSPDPASPPSPAARLLNAVRKLIDYGKQLAASLHQGSITSVVANAFGTADIALILARITQGLHRALVLEERIVRTAARLDADPRSKPASSARAPHASRPPTPRATEAEPDLTPLPTPEQITAKARRQPIGAVIAEICSDLGILPSHPLWRELQRLITKYNGNYARLVIDIVHRPFLPVVPPDLAPSPAEPPAQAATGPPPALAATG
jgi:hypothetical protein